MERAIAWLMEGDPAIRWQTMRDLCDRPVEEWQSERRRTIDAGWGSQFLECLRPNGTWPPGRWTGTVWTLLTVMDCGLPANHPALHGAAHRFLDHNLQFERTDRSQRHWRLADLCHLGFWMRIAAYFQFDQDRSARLAQMLLDAQMADGGWNCRKQRVPSTRHSSFHTTLNVLEGLSPTVKAGIVPVSVFRESEARALEFLLAHKLYRSDRTGEIINERFTHLTFPSHWHYTVLRGLDYLRSTDAIHDSRVDDPIELLQSRRRPNDSWTVEKRIPGTTLFDLEKPGGDSRWNTLRALRILKSRQAE